MTTDTNHLPPGLTSPRVANRYTVHKYLNNLLVEATTAPTEAAAELLANDWVYQRATARAVVSIGDKTLSRMEWIDP